MKVEEKELIKLTPEIESSIKDVFDETLRHMGWDVPEIDEEYARTLVLNEIKKAVEKLENGNL